MLGGGRKRSSSRERCRGGAMRRLNTGSRIPVYAPLPFSFEYSAKLLPKFGGAASCCIHLRPLQATDTALNRAVIQFLKHSWNMQLCYEIRITKILAPHPPYVCWCSRGSLLINSTYIWKWVSLYCLHIFVSKLSKRCIYSRDVASFQIHCFNVKFYGPDIASIPLQ